MATMADSRLRVNPRSSAMGRNKGPTPMRMPTVSSVSNVAAATMFQPKYQLVLTAPNVVSGWYGPPCGLYAGQIVDDFGASCSRLSVRRTTRRAADARWSAPDRRAGRKFTFLSYNNIDTSATRFV